MGADPGFGHIDWHTRARALQGGPSKSERRLKSQAPKTGCPGRGKGLDGSPERLAEEPTLAGHEA